MAQRGLIAAGFLADLVPSVTTPKKHLTTGWTGVRWEIRNLFQLAFHESSDPGVRDGEEECRPLSNLPFRPDPTSVPMDDALDDG